MTELYFSIEAIKKGYNVVSLFSSHSYDVLLVHKKRFIRVQVKYSRKNGRSYNIALCRRSNAVPYDKRHCDVIAVYVKDQRSWFLFPVNECPSSLGFKNRKNAKAEKYRNAWHHLKEVKVWTTFEPSKMRR